MKALDDMLHEKLEGPALATPALKLDVCIGAGHPAGFCPQVAMRALEDRLHILHQHALQLLLVRLLQTPPMQLLSKTANNVFYLPADFGIARVVLALALDEWPTKSGACKLLHA